MIIMCMHQPFISLDRGKSITFAVPGLHLHKHDIVLIACNHVEDRHDHGNSFTLVPSCTSSSVLVIGEELGAVVNTNVLAVEILSEIVACEQRLYQGGTP